MTDTQTSAPFTYNQNGSILDDVKKTLGLGKEYTPFDTDIVIYINGVFSTLTQLGVGPEMGFSISGSSETWNEFIQADNRLNAVRTYITLRVKLLFDPPTTSFALDAISKQITELEWRLNVTVDAPYATHEEGVVIDD